MSINLASYVGKHVRVETTSGRVLGRINSKNITTGLYDFTKYKSIAGPEGLTEEISLNPHSVISVEEVSW
jgi:hypothetical protein